MFNIFLTPEHVVSFMTWCGFVHICAEFNFLLLLMLLEGRHGPDKEVILLISAVIISGTMNLQFNQLALWF